MESLIEASGLFPNFPPPEQTLTMPSAPIAFPQNSGQLQDQDTLEAWELSGNPPPRKSQAEMQPGICIAVGCTEYNYSRLGKFCWRHVKFAPIVPGGRKYVRDKGQGPFHRSYYIPGLQLGYRDPNFVDGPKEGNPYPRRSRKSKRANTADDNAGEDGEGDDLQRNRKRRKANDGGAQQYGHEGDEENTVKVEEEEGDREGEGFSAGNADTVVVGSIEEEPMTRDHQLNESPKTSLFGQESNTPVAQGYSTNTPTDQQSGYALDTSAAQRESSYPPPPPEHPEEGIHSSQPGTTSQPLPTQNGGAASTELDRWIASNSRAPGQMGYGSNAGADNGASTVRYYDPCRPTQSSLPSGGPRFTHNNGKITTSYGYGNGNKFPTTMIDPSLDSLQARNTEHPQYPATGSSGNRFPHRTDGSAYSFTFWKNPHQHQPWRPNNNGGVHHRGPIPALSRQPGVVQSSASYHQTVTNIYGVNPDAYQMGANLCNSSGGYHQQDPMNAMGSQEKYFASYNVQNRGVLPHGAEIIPASLGTNPTCSPLDLLADASRTVENQQAYEYPLPPLQQGAFQGGGQQQQQQA